jgi:hypothetical protein
MPYVKISDPNIIDLAAWQQVINVINQHSDTLSAITNNFGLQGSGTTNWNDETEIYEEFNLGSQKILYGKFIIDTRAGDNQDASENNNRMFYREIDFDNGTTGTASFSAKPVITVSAQLPGSVNTTDRNVGLTCTVIALTKEKFSVRIVNSRELTGELGSTEDDPRPVFYFHVNWIAIGPK